MRKYTDLAGDLDEFTAIKRIAEIEIDLVDSWLYQINESQVNESQINESQESVVDQEKLLELRYLCQLRNRLLANIEADFLTSASLPERTNSGAVSSGVERARIPWTG